MLSFKVSFGRIKSKMSKLAKGLSPESMDIVTKGRASEMLEDFKTQTPIRWTGKTRNAWTLVHNKTGSWSVRNYKKAMKYLLRGTRPHSAVTKNRMFIPLNAVAADNYRARAAYAKRAERAQKRGKAAPTKKKEFEKLRYGVDYVLARFVRGVVPMKLRSRGVYYGGESKATAPSDRFVREYLKKLKSQL
jgi:hypothetical protein